MLFAKTCMNHRLKGYLDGVSRPSWFRRSIMRFCLTIRFLGEFSVMFIIFLQFSRFQGVNNPLQLMKKLTWHKIEPFHSCKPTERWGHSSCVIGNDLVVFGGYADSYYMNDLWVFSTLTLQWKYYETTGAIPEPRSNATLNYDKQQNRLVLFGGGGQGKKRFNSIFALDWATKKWVELEPQNNENKPWQRTYHVSEIIDKYLIVFGGENFADLNDLWLFDMQLKIWQQAKIPQDAPHPAPRRFHSSVLRNNELIIIGGCHGKYRSLKDVFTMNFNEFLVTRDINFLSWKQVIIESSDFIPRWGHSSSYNELNDKIYIFGGRFSNDLQDIIIVDLSKRTSKKVYVNPEDTPCPRRRHSANFIGCSLLIFGGFNGNYFNDLYSICIPSDTPIPKYTKDSTILFSQLLKKEPKATVSFLERYVAKFQNFYEQLRTKYVENQIDEILTSIVRGYAIVQEKYNDEIERLQNEHLIDTKIFLSKQHKIEYVRSEYTMCHVLQEMMSKVPPTSSQSKPLGWREERSYSTNRISNISNTSIQDNQNNTFSSNSNFKLFPPHQASTQIILINEMDFYHYLQAHNKVTMDQEGNTQKVFYNYKYQEQQNHPFNQQDKLFVEFNKIGKFCLDPVVKFVNPYFYHSFKDSSVIGFESIDVNSLKILQVGLMFVEMNVLVVPRNFTFEQWKGLAQFANYFCVNDLLQIIEKFFIAKLDPTNITELSLVSCDMRMKRLMHKCAQLIIERQQQKFFLSTNPSTSIKKITPQLFQQFEHKFFSKLENFLYPLEFQIELTHEFDINKLNIFLRNIHKMREMNGNLRSSGKMCDENEEKENEENLVLIR